MQVFPGEQAGRFSSIFSSAGTEKTRMRSFIANYPAKRRERHPKPEARYRRVSRHGELPKASWSLEGRRIDISPPSPLVSVTMQLSMVIPT
jgi:hypothetical protein